MKRQYDLLIRISALAEQLAKIALQIDGIFHDHKRKQESQDLDDVAIAIKALLNAGTDLHHALGARLSDIRNGR